MRGLQDPQLYFPNSLGLLVPVRLELDLGPRVVAALDGHVGGLIITDGEMDDQLTVQVAPSIGAWLADSVILGLRAPVAALPTMEGDFVQASLEPFLVAHAANAFVSVRAVLPLDEPSGPFTEDNKFWGLFFAVGGAL